MKHHTIYTKHWRKVKKWKTFPGYAHDSEFEADRSLLDNEVVTWIYDHVVQITGSKVTQ